MEIKLGDYLKSVFKSKIDNTAEEKKSKNADQDLEREREKKKKERRIKKRQGEKDIFKATRQICG